MNPIRVFPLLLLCACQSGPAPYVKVGPDPQLSAAGPVVLTVTPASGKAVTFTRAQLAALGLVSFTTPDPSRKNEVHEYTGPLLSSVLDAAGIAPDATLHLTAHDRYSTDLKLGPLRDVPVIVALKSGGELLELRNYGPVYLTFPYHAFKLDPTVYNAAWVWQMMGITERTD